MKGCWEKNDAFDKKNRKMNPYPQKGANPLEYPIMAKMLALDSLRKYSICIASYI